MLTPGEVDLSVEPCNKAYSRWNIRAFGFPDFSIAPTWHPDISAGRRYETPDCSKRPARITYSPKIKWLALFIKILLFIARAQCCVFIVPVNACADWSVSGGSGLVQIDENGLLTVSSVATDGMTFTVTADIEEGRRVLTQEYTVYTLEARPWVGSWQEVMQFDCADGAEVLPEQAIQYMNIQADGELSFVWESFEVYIDYAAAFNSALGSLNMSILYGNYEPEDFEGSGSFSMPDSNTLEMYDIWLGTPMGGTEQNCGHRFIR
ncbi:MAG: hypothetical protein GY868_15410 [Deltaproteobacteria bacterium]|nr:hypothetical protein [Deltaproteobacteria bacterium]